MGDRHFAFWPVRAPRTITLPETSLWCNVEVSASRFPHKPCLVFYDRAVTFAEFKRDCEYLAGFLQRECGVQRGDRVALFMHNSPQFVMAYYAILRADAMVVPINPMNLTGEVGHILDDSGARVVIAPQELHPQIEPLIGSSVDHAIVACYADYIAADTDLDVPAPFGSPRAAIAGTGVSLWHDVMRRQVAPRPHVAGPDDLCVMPYTSGTTGHPKGCLHRHRSVMHTTVALAQWVHLYQDDTGLAVLPFFHVTGMQNSMNTPIYTGATMVILPRWDRDVAATLISRYRVRRMTVVPTMVVDLLSSPNLPRYDLSSLTGLGGGGAAMPEAIAHKLEHECRLNYLEGYGLSETMAPTHINPEHHAKKQCLGIPIFNTEARVVDPETLQELPPGEVGEIIACGPQVFDGYWNNPEANARCFVTIDGKRFFRTGDLGRVDEEGFFFIVDRLKRMINAAGFKVWPAEVETILYAHPAIQEAVIIAKPDARRGETVKAVVVLTPEARHTVTADDLTGWAREHMAAYKVPREWEIADALPKSATGKIQWRVLQERENARTSLATATS